MADTDNRKINIWINGEQVENNVKKITSAMRTLINTQAKMTIGSKEYVEAGKKITQLKGILDDHRNNLKQVSSSWDKVKQTMLGVAGGNIISGAFTRLTSIISGAISGAYTKIKEFGSGISELKALTGLHGEDLKKLEKSALDMGAQYGTSGKEIVEAMKLVGSARPELLGNADALASMTDKVMILSKASGLDLKQSTDALAGSLNQFNAPASKAGEYIDILAKAAQAGTKEIPFLSDFVLRSGKIAADANLSFRDLVTTAEILGPSFESPERASTALNRILINLQKDGLGYGSGKFSLADGLKDVQKHLDGLATESEKAAYQNLIFGEGITAGKILLEKGAKGVEEFSQMMDKASSATEQANERMNNLQGDLDKAGGAWDKFILSLDNGTGPISSISRALTQLFTTWVEDLTTINDANATFEQKLVGWAGTVNMLFPGIRKAVSEGTAAFKELFSTSGSNTWDIKDLMTIKEKTEKTKAWTKAKYEEIEAIKKEAAENAKKTSEKSTGGIDVEAEKEKQKKADDEVKKRADEAKRKAEEEKKELEKRYDDYLKKYNDFQGKLQDLNDKYFLEGVDSHTKEREELRMHWDETLKTQQTSIDFLEQLGNKRTTKETELLEKLKNQRLQLIDQKDKEELALANKHANELMEKQQELDDQYEKSRLDAANKIADVTMSEKDKEIEATYNKYQELIALAKEYGFETVGLYDAMKQSLADTDKQYAVDDKEKKDPIFGMTEEDWGKFQEKVDGVLNVASALGDAWGAYNELRNQQDQQELDRIQVDHDAKKSALDAQLAGGLISEKKYNEQVAKLDAETDSKKKKIERDQAQRDKKLKIFEAIINTAAGIAKALPNFVLAGIAAAMGAIQIATIATAPIPQMAKGGRIKEPTIAEIGEKGEEIVFSNKMITDPITGPLLNQLADIQEGKRASVGTYSRPNFSGMNEAIGHSKVNTISNSKSVDSTQSNTKINDMINESKMLNDKFDKMLKIWSDPKTRVKASLVNDEFKTFQEDEALGKSLADI
jgi:TP901 family phage tail tape measure protein